MPQLLTNDENLKVAEEKPIQAVEGRFLFADAIRGLAAISVVMRHLYYGPRGEALDLVFPSFVKTLHLWGAAGVYAFFVLSGFVIAHSLRNNSLSPRAIGNFILRRQIRLDPVYWTMLAIIVGFAVFKTYTGHPQEPIPSLKHILVNFFYLHGVLHVDRIVFASWTLCIEIQFYLLFILLLYAGRKGPRLHPRFNISKISTGSVLGLGIFALLYKHLDFHSAYFISYWDYFALGSLAYWAMQRAISPKIFFIFAALFAIDTLSSNPSAIFDGGPAHSLAPQSMIVGLLTALSLYYAGVNGLMGKWGNHPILQYLGRISYSLYLIHMVVITQLANWFFPAAGENRIVAIVWYLSVFVVSIASAQLLYILVEKPSMKLATRLKIS